MTAKSVSSNQSEILEWIMRLNEIKQFDLDMTYGNGGFWKNLPPPLMKIDIDPQQEGVVKASSVDVPVPDGMLSSIIFDPPFLTYIKSGREHNSVMAKRFGGYWRYDELVEHYTKTISEAHRLLVKNGIFVVKCQDIIHNHKLHPTHINITNWCSGIFRLKDFFVLPAENRMPMPESKTGVKRVQKHSRIHHSYFMVFEKI